MADAFYGVALGGDSRTDVTEATSTTSAIYEFKCTHSTTGVDKVGMLKALAAIRDYIVADTFPPA